MTDQRNIVCVQHILYSSSILFDGVVNRFDSFRKSIFGKNYSTIEGALNASLGRWGAHFHIFRSLSEFSPDCLGSKTLVLDEGAGVHDRLPDRWAGEVAGVEQTTAGMRNTWKYPTVLVCRSAAKLMFESQIIARGVLRKLASLSLLDGRTVGVIGIGALGGELSRQLSIIGYPHVLYDPRPLRDPFAPLYRPLDELLAISSLVLGATGRDCLRNISLENLASNITFASCSSSNVEFGSVLRELAFRGAFETANGPIGTATVSVLNGGYPINFDRETEWETREEMWLTRQLCLEGLGQADTLVGSDARGVMLDPVVQARLVNDWLERVPEPETLRLPPRLDEEYFRAKSEGEYQMTRKPNYKLHSTTPGALEKMRCHTEPYDVQVAGVTIAVLPNVWSPKYDWSSAFYIENFPEVEGLSFLEIGSGTGVISVYAGLHGASRVVAVDVNPDAVRNTQFNFERHALGTAEAILSEVFDQVRGRFDIITWNAPYHGNRPADPLERGCSDEDYRGIRAFFRQADGHLKPGGSIVFGFSESGDLPLIRSLIRDAGYSVKREFSDWRQGYNCMLLELVRTEPDRSPI